MSNQINFSPNMLKTYDKCPQKYYFKYIEKISIPQSANQYEKGQKIHALAHYFLEGINISRIETALTKSEREIWNKLLNNKYFQMDCIKTEYPLQIKLKDYWIGGRIDAIVHRGYDYFILDYKTGTIPQKPKYDYQTIIYFLCANKFIEDYKSLVFVYIDLKNNQNIEIKFESNIKYEYEKLVSKKCEEITNTEIFSKTKASKDCINCEYKKLCMLHS